jgi:uncharacterized membrane protein YeaQ/YmgE (transglycosylase-associated protein family)
MLEEGYDSSINNNKGGVMGIIVWIIVGALAGWIASMIMKVNGQMGALENIIAGIVGAFVGGWVLELLGITVPNGELNIPSIFSAVLGAIIVIWIVKMIRGRSAA